MRQPRLLPEAAHAQEEAHDGQVRAESARGRTSRQIHDSN